MDELRYFTKRTDERLERVEDKLDKLMESRALASFFVSMGTSITIAVIQFFLLKK